MINYKIYDQLSNSVLKNIIKNIYKDNKNFFFQSILFLNSCKKIYYENNNNLKIIIILKNAYHHSRPLSRKHPGDIRVNQPHKTISIIVISTTILFPS